MRALIVMVAALAVSGCGLAATPAPTYVAGPGSAPVKSLDAGGQAWSSRCVTDRFTDHTDCVLSASLGARNSTFMAGIISSRDAGRNWTVTVTPAATAVRVRVDAKPAMTIPCDGPTGACVLDAATSRILTGQLRSGRRVAFEARLPAGPADADFSAEGFTAALNAASAGKNLN